jgi:hypothetical protein
MPILYTVCCLQANGNKHDDSSKLRDLTHTESENLYFSKKIKKCIIWDAIMCSLIQVHLHFGGKYCLHLPCTSVCQARCQQELGGLLFAGCLLSLFFVSQPTVLHQKMCVYNAHQYQFWGNWM